MAASVLELKIQLFAIKPLSPSLVHPRNIELVVVTSVTSQFDKFNATVVLPNSEQP